MSCKRNIADIVIGERTRTDLGDLAALAESIQIEGLLQPPGITEDNELVFGYRRLLACRDNLHWIEIDVRVVNVTSILAGEYAENEIRKDFTVSERVAILERMGRLPPSVKACSQNFAGIPTEAEAARRAGLGSRTTAQAAAKVVKQGVPELVAAMDKKEIKIDAAARIASQAPERQKEIVNLPKPERRVEVAKIRTMTRGNSPPLAAPLPDKSKTVQVISGLKRNAPVPSPQLDKAIEAVLPILTRNDPISRNALSEKLDVSHATVELAAGIVRERLKWTKELGLDEPLHHKSVKDQVEILKRRFELRTQQLEAAHRARMAQFEEQFNARVEVAAHKIIDEEMLPLYNRNVEQLRATVNALRNPNGHMTLEEFQLIQRCLHPDRAPPELRDQYTRAFQKWQSLKEILVGTNEVPTAGSAVPRNYAEWQARRARV